MAERFTPGEQGSLSDSSEQDSHWSVRLRAANRPPTNPWESIIGLAPDGQVVMRLNLTGGKIVDIPIGSKNATAEAKGLD